MGSKVKCPSCGAKNDQSSRRCRLCTDLINPDGPDVDAPEEVEAPPTAGFFDANEINRQVTPARDRFGRGATGLGARIAAAQGQVAPTAAAPASMAGSEPGWRTDDLEPAPTAPLSAPPIETVAAAPWPPPASPFDDAPPSDGAIAFENRPAAPTAPPIEYEAEPFDSDALFRDRG